MTALEIRTYIVDTIDTNPNINFREHGINVRLWKLNMKKSGAYCDDFFISHMAFLLDRDIHVIPVFENDMRSTIRNDMPRDIPVNQNDKLSPIYVLHYPDTRFRVGHYQSIRPLSSEENM